MMDTYSNSGRSVKQESNRDSTDSPASDKHAAAASTEAENLMDMQQQIQQLLAASSAGVTSSSAALLSPLHFLQASDGAAGAAASLSIPWNMMPQYQMMLLAGQNAGGSGGEDAHLLAMPTDAKGNGAVSAAQQKQLLDAASLQMVLQQQLNAVAGAGSEQALVAQIANAGSAVAAADQRARQAALQQQQQLQQQQATQQRQNAQQQQDMSKPSPPRPPKKPLTPYMMFSKSIWPQVKAANTHLSSVTEIGAIIGSLWRELGPEEKHQYNEQFTRDKQRYEEELRAYLKNNGLHPSDLIKARSKKKEVAPRPAEARHNPGSVAHLSAAHQPAAAASRAASATAGASLCSAEQQLVQALVGYQGDGLAASGLRSGAGDGANSLPNFSQAWAGQPVQQLLAQMGLAGQVYANSDGTISVDNANLASLLALQPQLLQQAQLYTEQGSNQMKHSPGKELTSWLQTSSAASSGRAPSSQPSSTPVLVQPNGLPLTTTNGSASSDDHQYSEYFTVNSQGQLVKHTGPVNSANIAEYALRITQLEAELIRSQSALLEKTQENDRLKQELGEAFHLVTEYRQQQQNLAAAAAAAGDRAAAAAAVAASSAAATSASATSG